MFTVVCGLGMLYQWLTEVIIFVAHFLSFFLPSADLAQSIIEVQFLKPAPELLPRIVIVAWMEGSKGWCCIVAQELLVSSRKCKVTATTNSVSSIFLWLHKCTWMPVDPPLMFSGRIASTWVEATADFMQLMACSPPAAGHSKELLPPHCSWTLPCAGFPSEFPLNGKNRSAFQHCHLPSLLSDTVFIPIPARSLVTG